MTHTPPVISFAGNQGTDHERSPALSQYLRPALFEGQLHIVTGGGSGIGRCTAHELASLGATVVVIGQAAKVMEIITRAKFENRGKG